MLVLALVLLWRWLRRSCGCSRSGAGAGGAAVTRQADLEAAAVACLELLADEAESDDGSGVYRACALVLAAPYAATFPAALGTLLSDACPHPLLGGLHVSQVVTVRCVRSLTLGYIGDHRQQAGFTCDFDDAARSLQHTRCAVVGEKVDQETIDKAAIT